MRPRSLMSNYTENKSTPSPTVFGEAAKLWFTSSLSYVAYGTNRPRVRNGHHHTLPIQGKPPRGLTAPNVEGLMMTIGGSSSGWKAASSG
ncbi:MAG: hypothetical protein QW453_05310 [Thermoprotei archaeon]